MNINKLLIEKRGEILNIAARHGAGNLQVFGSVARGDFDAGSDLGILVDMEPGRSLLDHAGLIIELEKLLGCKVDVATRRGLKERFRDRILKEAVPI